ncbi:MAG: hypothetical protein IAB19_05205 [Proteobacteria bacterium]|uniref:Carbohydrate kinase PfkB domain-containing protein n=1 Tax=Candidatus Avisuccinivibrio stercorigallinarum TaxID=2840704 RepID=A0A9D9DC86_9GAMM|nr:hypothetical protein [Candidatus Avisuccinivibrio stercorigallinarum]
MRKLDEILNSLRPQKRALILGSIFVDLLINCPQLPKSGADSTAKFERGAVGGCAFNCADVLLKLGLPFDNLLPLGHGFIADFAAKELARRNFKAQVVDTAQDNGFCITFIEKSGERSFVTMPGLELNFKEQWFDALPLEKTDLVYLSGYQCEGSGIFEILKALQRLPYSARIVFDPGPRTGFIAPEVYKGLEQFKLIYALNAEEAMLKSGASSPQEAAAALSASCSQPAVVTEGARGAWLSQQGQTTLIPGFKIKLADTVGSGDAHSGGLMAGLICGLPLEECVLIANATAAAVSAQQGAACALGKKELLELLAGQY